MSTAAKMSSATFAPPSTASTEPKVEVLFPRCLTTPKTSPTSATEPAPAAPVKKKSKKKKAANGGIKTKKKSKAEKQKQAPVSPPGSEETEAVVSSAVTTTTSTCESSSNKAPSSAGSAAACTGALADILDLDFGAVQNNEVKQYILDPQETFSSKSYSTREPLRPSPLNTAPSHCVTNENNIEKSSGPPPPTLSSNSSTASSSGSRRPSSSRKQATTSSSEATNNKSAPNTTASVAAVDDTTVLRDTKIEIAGGREVYSQSKARSARHKNRQRHSGDQQPQYVPPMSRGQEEVISNSYQQPQPKVLKETVFSSEIHSIEYNSPMASSGSSSGNSPKMLMASGMKQPQRAKNINVDTGVVVFDDIKDCDVNVTYDLIDGEFPPPNISGLIVRDPNDLLTSDDLPRGRNNTADDLEGFCFGSDEGDRRSEASSGGSKIIGDITIAEYEGSPRRYRPRPSPPQTCESVPKQPKSRPPLRLPGFPQRVLPAQADDKSSPPPRSSSSSGSVEKTEELLKFEEPLKSQQQQPPSSSSNNDYESKMRYEFSETRKVLDEFFHKEDMIAANSAAAEEPAQTSEKQESNFSDLNYVLRKNNNYVVGQRLASEENNADGKSLQQQPPPLDTGISRNLEQDLLLTSPTPVKEGPPNSLEVMSSASSFLTAAKGPILGVSPLDQPLVNFGTSLKGPTENDDQPTASKVNGQGSRSAQQQQPAASSAANSANDLDSRNFTLSPETTDCDSADLESEMSVNEGSFHSSGPRMHTAMPVLEDGLSSGHASDLEDDVIYSSSSGSVVLKKQQGQQGQAMQPHHLQQHNNHYHHHHHQQQKIANKMAKHHELLDSSTTPTKFSADNSAISSVVTSPTSSVRSKRMQQQPPSRPNAASVQQSAAAISVVSQQQEEPKGTAARNNGTRVSAGSTTSEPPLTVVSNDCLDTTNAVQSDESVAAALKDIKMAIQATRVLQHQTRIPPTSPSSSVAVTTIDTVLTSSLPSENGISEDPWIKRQQLQQQDIPTSSAAAAVLSLPSAPANIILPQEDHQAPPASSAVEEEDEDDDDEDEEDDEEEEDDDEEEDEEDEEEEESESSDIGEERVPTPKNAKDDEDLDTDQETDRLLGQQYNDDNGYYDQKNEATKKKGTKTKEAVTDPKVLIEGVLFRARYLGSTQLVCDGQPTKATRMMQAEEAVSRIKAPDGESQPSTEVDLFISTEKIMVLNTDLKEIMMDHSLRSISYIADIGDLLVIMARRRIMPQDGEELQVIGSTPKMICHVFESEEAQFIAQSIGQAFQVAYVEFLKANGIEDHSFVKEMDYQEVLNSQEIFGNELALFAKKELQKEVVVPKAKGEILGVVIVESGWGSMLPTIVLANLLPSGPAARCGQLNIGDQVIAINGISLVGLPLSTCQTYIKNTKNKTAVKLTAVSCAPVVEVKIKRPDTKYQLGFSVQNGVICSLLRGGIAERGGVRVGHRIIEINGQSVVAVPHEKIVNLLATSVGEITMKTMPTSMFRLLTGQETPLYI